MEEYIPKSALVAEIERRLWLLVPKMTFHQQREELEKLLSFINNLEVKGGDLDALGVLANHLIACNAHGITPKYSDKELDFLEGLANNKAQK